MEEGTAKEEKLSHQLTAAITEPATRRRLFSFIRARVSSDEDAEDIVQDIFYNLVQSYEVTAPIENLVGWLYRTARNKIIDLYRKKRPDNFSAIDQQTVESTAIDAATPEEDFSREKIWMATMAALETLPEKQREVFMMNELQGMTFKEISELTGESINTLLSRKRYAVLALRKKLEYLYDDYR